jgi:hypothetical protein
MPRRLLKVEAKRLILTCFETFIEANRKQLTKMNIANKVNSICAVLLYTGCVLKNAASHISVIYGSI